MFVFISSNLSVITALKQILMLEPGFEISQSNENKIDVNPKGISKASGLKRICDEFSYSSKDIIAIGDNGNDLAMIKWAGMGVAMGNANQEVKDRADKITLDNSNDGVAFAIKTYILAQ